MLGGAGWFRAAVPAAYGGLNEKIDVRTLCLTRMTLGYHAALADFAFAMQGLGTGAISLFGSVRPDSSGSSAISLSVFRPTIWTALAEWPRDWLTSAR